jgi:asparagine synthase (glutamine-hydrolysing)
VLLGRDRLGIKPLYLTEDAHRVRFASSLTALPAGGDVDTRIDPIALHHYLTFHSVVPPPRTILRGVTKVPPASLVAIEPDGRRTTTTYWEPDFTRREERADWSERDWEDAVLASLRLAVERRLVADVPVGCLLSGGVDSSLIVGLLAEAGQHGLATFSIGFESVGGVAGDEFRYSDIIAERFDTDHHQIRIGTDRMLPALDGAIGAMSEPMVSHDCVAFYLLSQEVAKHVKELCLVAVTAADAIGIPVTGIDLLVPDVTGADYAFIEANERPGLANHEPQPTAQAFVDYLFPGSPGLPQAWTPEEPPQ